MRNDFHKSVLLDEVLEYLKVQKGKVYLDATVGDGGHTIEILKKGGKVIGIDTDPQALERTTKRIRELLDRGDLPQDAQYLLIEGNFRDLDKLIDPKIMFAGVLFDVGVSTLQISKGERGFSFTQPGPLDMRMSPKLKVKAYDLVNGLNKGELYELFKKYAEKKDWEAKQLASAIVRSRPIKTTAQLADIVSKAVGGRRGAKIHPATTIFQAFRIAVNDELNAIKEALPKAFDRLEKEGRLLVISFHSLEDRIVKDLFRSLDEKGIGKILTKKPVVPTEKEITENVRSRSAKLRVVEKR